MTAAESYPDGLKYHSDHDWALIEGDEADISPFSNVPAWSHPLAQWRVEDSLRFKAHFGWTGAIEWVAPGEPALR